MVGGSRELLKKKKTEGRSCLELEKTLEEGEHLGRKTWR